MYAILHSDGERRGSIAGFLAEEGTAENNCFVSTELHGIDNISYAAPRNRFLMRI